MIKNFIPASVLSKLSALRKIYDSGRISLKEGGKGTSGMTSHQEETSGGYGEQDFSSTASYGKRIEANQQGESKGRRL